MKNQFELNKLSYFIIKETKKRETVCNIFSDVLVKSLNSKRGMLDYQLDCSCFISFPSVHTSFIIFHFYFLQFTIHLIHFIYHSPCTISFIFTLFGVAITIALITWSFNLIVSFTFQPIPSVI